MHSKQPAQTAPLALLTGGKSGGHVFPALAVGEQLRARGWKLAYAGGEGSMEERLASEHAIDFHPIAAAAVVGRGFLRRLLALGTLAWSSLRCLSLVRRLRPAVVLATGGFVSVPSVVAAWLTRRPVLLIEPNARAGQANRYLSRLAAHAALALADAAGDLRCQSSVTGVPVRQRFFEIDAAEIGATPGLLAVGGSQGSVDLNRAMPLLADRLRHQPCRLFHQVGRGRLHEVRELYGVTSSENAGAQLEDQGGSPADGSVSLRVGDCVVELTEFIDDMPTMLSEVDLVVSRAGAITLAELCAAARPAVLVPLDLAGGHQRQNAEAMAEAGAALSLESFDQLPAVVPELLDNPSRRRDMARSAAALARSDASLAIADLTERLAGASAEPSA